MKEIYSNDFHLFATVVFANLKEYKDEEDKIDIHDLRFYGKKENEKLIRSINYENEKIAEEIQTYKIGKLNKDLTILLSDRLLEENNLKKDCKKIIWKPIAVEPVVKVQYTNERCEYEWNVFPIKKLMINMVKLLHKTLCHIVNNAWLSDSQVQIEEKICISLRKYQGSKKLIINLSCPGGELFEKCKTFISIFLSDYIKKI